MPNLFEQATDRSAIDNATVFEKHMAKGRIVSSHFYGACRDLVERKAQDYLDECDEDSGAKMGEVIFDGQIYHCTVTHMPVPGCRCGKCDDCVAARSDEHYDRKRDGGE